MEYLIIIALQLLGIGFHVMQKVLAIDKQMPDDTLGEVFGKFWKADRITIFISILVLFLSLIAHFILQQYSPSITAIPNYMLYSFAVALVLGYAGQSLVYKLLGKLEKTVGDKIDNSKP